MTSTLRKLTLIFVALGAGEYLLAQRDRVFAPINPARKVALNGSLRPPMLRQDDEGPVVRAFPLPAMTLYLKRSAGQDSDLRRLLEAQRNPASPQYRQWLTPDQFGDRFGLSVHDVSATAEWLRSRGFAVGKVARSRTWIVFSGTAGQVEDAFSAPIHRYRLNGKAHFANSVEPSLPEGLSDVVAGVEGLDDFEPDAVQPKLTVGSGVYDLMPDDLAAIYDIARVYQSGIDGAGQKIAIMGATQFNAAALADVAQFRSIAHLPANVPQVVLDTDYPDPGVTGSAGEAHLDIEWSGAIARAATIVYVYSNTALHAMNFAVDNNLAPIISMSFTTGCEASVARATMAFYQGIAQQANAQGITLVNSGGDTGAAGCDANGSPIAQNGLSVRFPQSIPELTAVGGTEFNEHGGYYWTTINTANGESALSYIPEMVWNDSMEAGTISAGGGGASTYFPKPAWQVGPGVPDDGARDLPDIAMAASARHDGFVLTVNGVTACCSGGTSASAPMFAGVLALLNHYLLSNGLISQPGLGNVNPTLYRLASTTTGVFHDITVGGNIVPCQTGTKDCSTGAIGFSAGPGYDQASGLGSIDMANLLTLWNTQPAGN